MKSSLYMLIGIVFFSCQQTEKNHAHDSEGNHIEENSSSKIPRSDYTIWTNKTELFVEFPVLIVGKKSRFAAHFTTMEKHKAILEGKVTVSLIQGTKGIRQTIDSPRSPGIFSPVLKPLKSGKGNLEFVLQTKEFSDTITIFNIPVFNSIKEAIEKIGVEKNNTESITFLKEQAWKMEFQTMKVDRKEIYQSISTFGKWQNAPKDSKTIIANSNGKISYSKKAIVSGEYVEKGDALLYIDSKEFSSNNVNRDLQTTKTDLQQIESEYKRKELLFKDKIIPLSEFELVSQKYLNIKAQYNSLLKGYSKNGYSANKRTIKAPFSGYLQNINIENGSFVKEGDPLFTIRKSNANVLKVNVNPENSNLLNTIKDIWFKTNNGHWTSMQLTGGKILSIDNQISDTNPTISVFAEINEDVNMPKGSFSEVNITLGNGEKGILIPKSALLESYGKYSVIVQLSGESFEQRNVSIGRLNGKEIEIVDGLQAGEVIVSKGAYQVKMQAMSGAAPAHGHAH